MSYNNQQMYHLPLLSRPLRSTRSSNQSIHPFIHCICSPNRNFVDKQYINCLPAHSSSTPPIKLAKKRSIPYHSTLTHPLPSDSIEMVRTYGGFSSIDCKRDYLLRTIQLYYYKTKKMDALCF